MIHPTDPNLLGEKPNKKKNKPTGILKDLLEIKRCYIKVTDDDTIPVEDSKGAFVEYDNLEAIINKYLNP